MKITPEELSSWKKDLLTQEVFKALETIRDDINESLKNIDILLGDKTVIARLIGQKEGISLILDISADEVSTDEEDASSWSQSVS
jgi:hypothetical protein